MEDMEITVAINLRSKWERMTMPARKLVKCSGECGRDFFPNQLVFDMGPGGKVGSYCKDCMAKPKLTHGEIQRQKSDAAKATAWNCGEG